MKTIALFLSLFFSSLVAQGVVLRNDCKNWSDIFFEYIDYTDKHVTSYELGLHESKSRFFTINSDYPIFINFSKDFKNQPLYLFPSDTLIISCNTYNTAYYLSGNRGAKQFMFFSQLEGFFSLVSPNFSAYEVTPRLDFEFVVERSEEKYHGALKSLADLESEQRIETNYREAIYSSIVYRNATELLFPYYKSDSDPTRGQYVPKFYKENLFELNNLTSKDSLLYLKDYRVFLRNFAKFLFAESGKSWTIDSNYFFVFENFNGKSRDYILFDLLNRNLGRGYQQTEELVKHFNKVSSVEEFKQQINSIKTIRIAKNTLDCEIEDLTGNKLSFSEALGHRQNEIIFIDFWASWCSPCISEIPNSLELKTIIKNVDFVYISIDRDVDSWKKAVRANNLDGAENFRINPTSEFLKVLNIPPIPRYLIIDKSGKVIAADALRPSNLALQEVLQSLAKLNTND